MVTNSLKMYLNLNRKKPLCPQICEQICSCIVNGNIKPGERIESVRDFSNEINVNPNTVQNAFVRLRKQGVLTSIRGTGWFVSRDLELIHRIHEETIMIKTKEYIADMYSLGMSLDELKEYVKEF